MRRALRGNTRMDCRKGRQRRQHKRAGSQQGRTANRKVRRVTCSSKPRGETEAEESGCKGELRKHACGRAATTEPAVENAWRSEQQRETATRGPVNLARSEHGGRSETKRG